MFFDWLQALNVESSTLDKRIYAHFNFNLNYKNKENKVQKLLIDGRPIFIDLGKEGIF